MLGRVTSKGHSLAERVGEFDGPLHATSNLVMWGADTTADKSVVGKLGDLLMHRVHNAIDHGIAAPGNRRLALTRSRTSPGKSCFTPKD